MPDKPEQNRGCLFALLSRFWGKSVRERSLPYRMRDDFLSAAEGSFYHVLRSVAGDAMVVCPKVGLTDLFFVQRPNENYAYRGRISQKHVDFVLCDARTMRPLLGIELDDASHTLENRKTRDAFVDKVFRAAALPLVRIRAQRAYNPNEIREEISRAIRDAPSPASRPMPKSSDRDA
jgi:hypothetical protein